MKIHFKKLCVVSALSVATLIPSLAFAQGAPIVCPDYKKGTTNIPSERTGKKVSKALDEYNLDKVDEALTILYEIDTSNEFDRAFTDRFIGNLLATQPKNAGKALEYLNKSVKVKKLNDLEQAGTLRLIADLNMQEKKYADAVVKYKEWINFTCKEDADVYLRIATALYEEQKWAEIIEPINKSIKLADKPNKNAYALKLTSYYNRKMYKETVQVAEDTVTIFPDNKSNWTQLGYFYMLVEDYKKALSTFEIALDQGYLTKEAEIKALMQLYSTNNIPYKAATLFEKYMKTGLVKKEEKNLSTLASTWNQAKEPKKAAIYYGQAAAMSSDPALYYKQGESLYLSEQYKDALVALQKAVDAGAENLGRVHMLMMEANFYSGDFRKAYVHVQEAKKDGATARSARSWEPYIKEKAKNRGISL
ncbi:tetratricopeptide repeat protein [Paraglaciecola hydrolytica]|uniref:tetratricopeptide repeat protein n=1 Tax=Paraglaciecola hydrolytica TaxID=1799789 RepID=UPI000D08FB56|nr:hypothetical protein [Paraglaciecola hydrolytica]